MLKNVPDKNFWQVLLNNISEMALIPEDNKILETKSDLHNKEI